MKKSCAKNSLGSNTTKNKCVVLVSPFFRVGHIADLSKKYKFTPIVILSKNHDACGEEYQTIYENAQIIKKRNPNTIIITDNGKEFEKVVKELSKYDVEAIIPYEMSGKYVERLRERLKLKGNDLKLAFKRNKKWVNEQLEKNKLNVPKTIEYKFSELVKNSKVCFKRIAKEIKIPFVMKPLEGYGSVGTSVIKNENEFLKAVKTLDELAGKYKTIVQKLLFQEYIGGDEYIFNYQSIDGEHILTDAWIHNKMCAGSYVLHHTTATVESSDRIIPSVDKYCKKILDAIKWKHGATHIEVKYFNNKPYLIEVNFRCMGSHSLANKPVFANYPIHELTYLSMIENSPLKKFIGKEFPKTDKKLAIYKVNCLKSFTLKKDKVVTWARKNLKTFVEWIPNYKIGQKIPLTTDLLLIVGEVGLYGKRKDVEADLKKLEKTELKQNNLLFE